MLRLKRIKKSDGYIEAYYTPEDSEEEGYVKIRLADEEVVEQRPTEYEKGYEIYAAHAIYHLLKIKDEPDLSGSRLVMWY